MFFLVKEKCPSIELSFQAVSDQVLSSQAALTVVFGMGTSVFQLR